MRTPRKLMLVFENKPQRGSSKVCHPLFMLRDMDINLLLYLLVMLIRKSAQMVNDTSVQSVPNIT